MYMTKHFIYCYFDKSNNRAIYTGVHNGTEDDGYTGSGGKWKEAYHQRPKNYYRVIQKYFKNSKEAFKNEPKWIKKNKTLWPEGLNKHLGGNGGFDYINDNKLNPWKIDPEKWVEISKEKWKKEKGTQKEQWEKENVKNFYYWSTVASSKEKKKIGLKGHEALRKKYKTGWTFSGKSHTEEFKKRMSKIMSVKQAGKNNSQYGKMWITNGKISMKIQKKDPIPTGFRKGRVMDH